MCLESHWSSDPNYLYFSLGNEEAFRSHSKGGQGHSRLSLPGCGAECHGDGCNVFIISSPLLLEITRVSVSWGRSLPPGQCGKCLINTMAATIPTTLAVLLLLLSLLLLPLQPFSCRVHISNCWTLRMFCLHSSLSPTLHVHLQAEYFDVQCSGASE